MRKYIVKLRKVEYQEVTFIADNKDPSFTNQKLVQVAAAYCSEDSWSDASYDVSSLTSSNVTVSEKKVD